MITLTDAAKEYLADTLKSFEEREQAIECFRLTRDDNNRVALVAGTSTPDDVAIEHEQATILVLDPDLAHDLKGRTLDVVEVGEGQKSLAWTQD